MDGKTVILSMLIMSLVMAQIQAEEMKSCCPSKFARNSYDICSVTGFSPQKNCALISGCKIISSGTCPGGYNNDILQNTGDDVIEYCKLGCASSMCGALITLQNSDASEIVNGAVEKCTKACSTYCTKGSINGV